MKTRISKHMFAPMVVAALCSPPAMAANIFEVGQEGIGGNNQWPGGENPDFVIDGTTSKYLNFDDDDTFNLGFAITPESGASNVTSMEIWNANDAGERDPNSYEIWGSNITLDGSEASLSFADFTLVAAGSLLPDVGRNPGGITIAGAPGLHSEVVEFSNTESYLTYIVFFPTVQIPGAANSVQFAEVQLYDDASGDGVFAPGDTILGGDVIVPEPGSLGLLGLGTLMLLRRRR